MRRKVKRIPEERAIKIATEYLTTDITIKELQLKYGFKGDGNIHAWIRKFGLSKPTEEEVQIMNKTKSILNTSKREQELEKDIKALKKELEQERLKSLAFSKMIDIAENNMKISIRKKFGTKQ
jgi:transposase-like protein